jgi:hypothetical protein
LVVDGPAFTSGTPIPGKDTAFSVIETVICAVQMPPTGPAEWKAYRLLIKIKAAGSPMAQ